MLDVVSSISLSSFYFISVSFLDKLIGDIGLQLICQYLSYNRYPNLSEINFQDNLLTDSSLNTLSSLITSNKCYKLRLLNLTCNYINLSVGQLFVEFCSQHHITVQLGGVTVDGTAAAPISNSPPRFRLHFLPLSSIESWCRAMRLAAQAIRSFIRTSARPRNGARWGKNRSWGCSCSIMAWGG